MNVPGGEHNVTLLLRQLKRGDETTLGRIAELIYPELKKLARAQMRRERPGHLLQSTALVNEAYLRLVAHEEHNWKSRAHFFGAAAAIMRRILIDAARKRRPTVALDASIDDIAAEGRHPDFVALDEALLELERVSPRQARVVELRFFVGLTIPEAAAVTGRSARATDMDWAAARIWLRRRLTPPGQ